MCVCVCMCVCACVCVCAGIRRHIHAICTYTDIDSKVVKPYVEPDVLK